MCRIAFFLLSNILLFSCNETKNNKIILPYYNDPEFNPIFIINEPDVSKKIIHTINDFSFLNQDSITITQADIENKIHVANFIFTTCGSICPVMTNNFKILGDSLKTDNDVIMLSYSVTPWIDKPDVLKKYMNKNDIHNTNWHFLTGDRARIYQLARQSYFAEENIGFSKDSSEFLHTEHIILVDKTKRIRGIYNGTLSLEIYHLVEDIRFLQHESD